MQHFQETNDFLENSSFFYTIAIGPDSTYTYASKNYDRNFNHLGGSLVGKPFSINLHPDDIAICIEIGGKCTNNPGELFPATLRKQDGKGGYIFTQWEMKAMFDGDNNPAGVFCIGYNITEHVDTQSRLINAETEIASKNSKLTEIGLMQSHIIRKPLANIMGLSSVLSNMAIDPNLVIIRDMLLASAQELDMVINNISNKAE